MGADDDDALGNVADGSGTGLEDRRRYFRDIGLASTQHRIRVLERRAEALRSKPPALTSMTARVAPEPAMRSDSAFVSEAVHAHHRASTGSRREREEREAAKRELTSLVREYRDNLVEKWQAPHEVQLQFCAPGSKEKGSQLNTMCRRPHHRVLIGKDTKTLDPAALDKLIDPKEPVQPPWVRSLTKMRVNLFQRRLNLAIYERKLNEWTLPQIQQEIRRRGPEMKHRGSHMSGIGRINTSTGIPGGTVPASAGAAGGAGASDSAGTAPAP